MRLIKMGAFLKFFTKKTIIAITLAPFGVYFRRDRSMTIKSVVNHESIHWKQQMELMIVLFYVWYFLEWTIKTLLLGSNAYRSISFEIEAYRYELVMNYAERRKPFAWIKYLFILYPKRHPKL